MWKFSLTCSQAFLKHSSPAENKTRPNSAAYSVEIASSPSLTSENSPVEPKLDEVRTVSTTGASNIPEPTSSEKAAVNALLMAAMAMTEMGSSSSSLTAAVRSPQSSDVGSPKVKEPPDDSYCETPPKAIDLSEKLRDTKRQQPMALEIQKNEDTQYAKLTANEARTSFSDNGSTVETDDDSPKRDLPDETFSGQHPKVKRSRIGSHRKGIRNLGEEMISDDVNVENVSFPFNTYGHAYAGVDTMVETTPKAKTGKKEEITPVSARCIDFRRMNVHEHRAPKK
jgi:hypothetical protein